MAVAGMLMGSVPVHGQTGASPAASPVATPAGEAQGDAETDDPSKFFWFHKAGIQPDVAKADIETCFVQSGGIGGKVQTNPGAAFGLIGALVGGIVTGVMQANDARRMRNAAMRTCMGLYGYTRYRMPEAEWNAMMRAPDAIDRLTAYASGVVPATERLDA